MSIPFVPLGPVGEQLGDAIFPNPKYVLDGIEYGPDGTDYTGTAPECKKGILPFLIRGDDYVSESTYIETIITAPSDAGTAAECSAVFAGYNPDFQTGWKVTGGSVVNLGGGLWKLRSSLPGTATLACKPGRGYLWTHTLLDASGEIRTQKDGVTTLIDGFAVDRYEE